VKIMSTILSNETLGNTLATFIGWRGAGSGWGTGVGITCGGGTEVVGGKGTSTSTGVGTNAV